MTSKIGIIIVVIIALVVAGILFYFRLSEPAVDEVAGPDIIDNTLNPAD